MRNTTTRQPISRFPHRELRDKINVSAISESIRLNGISVTLLSVTRDCKTLPHARDAQTLKDQLARESDAKNFSSSFDNAPLFRAISIKSGRSLNVFFNASSLLQRSM
jgi:hypothetical protein